MKHYLNVCLLFIAGICGSNFSFSQISKELPLKYIRNEKGLGPGEDKVRCYIKIDTAQMLSEAGLKFSLRLKNMLKDSLKISNPLDLFNPSLLNDSGFNVIYSHISGMHGRTGPIAFKSVIVDYVAINGEPVEDSIGQRMYLTIPPKGNYEIFFRLIKSLKKNAPKPYNFDETIALPRGKYQFLVSLAIVNGKSFEQFKLDAVPINYKGCY